MKFLQRLNSLKIIALVVMVWGMLGSLTAAVHTFDSGASEKLTLPSYSAEADHEHLKPSVPVQSKNAEPQAETELRAEEDTTEKDDAESTSGVHYEGNGIWVKLSTRTGRALSRISGSNQLYILYHSWKIFLH